MSRSHASKKHQEAFDQLKKAKAKPEKQETIKQFIKDCEREIRDIAAKAQSIEHSRNEIFNPRHARVPRCS